MKRWLDSNTLLQDADTGADLSQFSKIEFGEIETNQVPNIYETLQIFIKIRLANDLTKNLKIKVSFSSYTRQEDQDWHLNLVKMESNQQIVELAVDEATPEVLSASEKLGGI